MSLVYLKNKENGVTYVYESVGYWDKEKKQARNNRKCIGKLDSESGEFIPSKNSPSIEIPQPKPGPVATFESKRKFCGATHLLDEIGEKLGVLEDLKKCFPEHYEQILSMAYYLVLEESNPISRFSKWASTHVHPFGKDIPSQRSSELFGGINEDSKQNFFVLQAKRRTETEFLAYDTTSISSYSETLKQVKYGLNKDGESLPQINLALLFGEESRLPVYYRKLPGNISDVKTISNLIADIDFLKLDKVKLVMDRGFYSEENINALYKKHYKFLISAKNSLKFVREKIDDTMENIISRQHYSSKYCIYYDSFTIDWNYSETKKRSNEISTESKRMYLHIFFNEQKATDDKISFNKLLDTLEEELISGKRSSEHEKLYSKYYEIKETPVKGVSLTAKQNAIDEKLKYSGYFALISNSVKEPLNALDIYRSKDVVEKAFGNLKERLNMRRTSVSSEENLDGKLFVQFVALIYLSYLKKQMADNNLFKNYTTQELLDELDVIEQFEQPGRKRRIGEITTKQLNLYKCMGVNSPSLV
jgi:transposase